MRNPMFVPDERTTELIFDYCRRRLSQDPVSLDYGGTRDLGSVLEGLLGSEGHDPAAVLTLFAEHLATAVISCDSPRFFSFIPAAPTKSSLLFDMVVSCSSLHGTSWLEAAGAVAAENQALALLTRLAGLPAGAGGCFVSGGSLGNLSALVVARDTAAKRLGRSVDRPRIAVSSETHSSVANALSIIGVAPFLVPTTDHRLTGAALRAALDADPTSDDVVGVVATAGTTNAGIVDELSSVAEVAGERALWCHVDAAYGGAALFAPSARHRFRGIELADSFIVDPHKWLFAPFDCAALLYRQPELARAVHTQHASYLDAMHDETAPGAGVWNPADYAFHLTRRARGLPLWFSLAVHGTDAYKDAVETMLELTRAVARRIEAAPHLRLVRDPELSVLLFERDGWGDEDYRAWSAELLSRQQAFVMPSRWEGRPVARMAFLHPDTTFEMVDDVLSPMA